MNKKSKHHIKGIFLVLFLINSCTANNNTQSEELFSALERVNIPRKEFYKFWDYRWIPISEEDSMRFGVTKNDDTKVFPAVNLYLDNAVKKAFLIGNDGAVLHTWIGNKNAPKAWEHAIIAENGDLIAIDMGGAIERLDSNSNLLWRIESVAHHDIYLSDDGYIYALGRIDKISKYKRNEIPLFDEGILKISQDGRIVAWRNYTENIMDLIPQEKLQKILSWPDRQKLVREIKKRDQDLAFANKKKVLIEGDSLGDIFHPNSLQVVDFDIKGFVNKGDFLVSFRDIDTIAILDSNRLNLKWHFSTEKMRNQHHAILHKDGIITVFNNNIEKVGSSALFIDPTKNKIIDMINGSQKEFNFYSYKEGAVYILPNKNILIVVSKEGRVFEITPEKEIVWEFLFGTAAVNSEDKKSKEYWRRTHYRFTKYPMDIIKKIK